MNVVEVQANGMLSKFVSWNFLDNYDGAFCTSFECKMCGVIIRQLMQRRNVPHPRRTHKIQNSAKTTGRIPVLSHLYVTRRHLVWDSWRLISKSNAPTQNRKFVPQSKGSWNSLLKQITKRNITRVSCACCKMHCLSLFFTNIDVEHIFQKVANLHDLRSNVTDFTWLYSEHFAKFQRGKCAERKI